jgi:hypothetical protein
MFPKKIRYWEKNLAHGQRQGRMTREKLLHAFGAISSDTDLILLSFLMDLRFFFVFFLLCRPPEDNLRPNIIPGGAAPPGDDS